MSNEIVYKTLREARDSGYCENGIISLERGYISRRADLEEMPVYMAAGKRRGEVYYYAPYYPSTRYRARIYLERW